jgi:para-nitrobenzyl esterase
MTMKAAIVIALSCFACASDVDELQVTVDTGVLHGTKQGSVRQFLGIPYADQPIGDLRWRAPQPAPKWTGVLQANAYGNECPQTLSFAGPSNTEDCLYLNVWSPSGAHDLPVMVWIHGGAFIFGSGNDKWYTGGTLVGQGVVVVTINYRLGALGFLAHPALDVDDPAYPTSGNYGLADQTAALQWVQRNIHAFGGDPKKVTMFGESAGGFSSCVHYLSPNETDLFQAAISESGFCTATVLAPGHATADSLGLDLGNQLGCPGGTASALACLRAVSVDTLLTATNLPPAANQTPGGPFYQASLLPNVVPNVDEVVVPDMLKAFKAGSYTPRPLLLGTNKDEGTLFHSTVYGKQVETDPDYQAALAVRFGSANVPSIIQRYPSSAFATQNDALAAVTGDAFFVCPARAVARATTTAGAPVYRYSFEHALENPFMQGLGVFHSSELPFVFGNDTFPLGKIGDSGAPISAAMVTDWTTFAKTLAPSADWPAYSVATDPYIAFGDSPAPASGLKTALCDFWDALPPP